MYVYIHRFPAGSSIWSESALLSWILQLELHVYVQQGFGQNTQSCVKLLMGIVENLFLGCSGIIITLH